MTDFHLQRRKVLQYDFGPFSFVAQRLAEDFGEVIYHTPWKESLPRPEKAMIGEGLDDITNAPDFWEALKTIDPERDLVAFFHVGEGSLQQDLRRRGYRVFGMGGAEVLEMDRYKFKLEQEKMGLPVIPYKHIVGIDALGEHFEELRDEFGDGDPKNTKPLRIIKISSYRWLSETFPYLCYAQAMARLRKLQHLAGAYQSKIEFIVEERIDGVEAGTDNFTANGKLFDKCLSGFELKDKAWVGKAIELAKVPKPLMTILTAMQPYLKEQGANGMFSTEARITDDLTPWWNDATMRGGMPPTESQCVMWKNFSDAVWAAAGGEMISLEPAAKYVAQVQMSSMWAIEEATILMFPEKVKQFIKIYNSCKIDGNTKYIPMDRCDIIAAAVGLGRTYEEAESNALDVASQISADSISYEKSCFEQLDEEIEKSEKIGLGKF